MRFFWYSELCVRPISAGFAKDVFGSVSCPSAEPCSHRVLYMGEGLYLQD